MNDGLNRGNSAQRLASKNYYTGYWAPDRQFGYDNPGEYASTSGSIVNMPWVATSPDTATHPAHSPTVTPTPIDYGWKTICQELPFDIEAFDLGWWQPWAAAGHSVQVSVDIAYGPPGFESIVLDRFFVGQRLANMRTNGLGDIAGPFPIRIPEGSRVAWRMLGYPNSGWTVTTDQQLAIGFHRHYQRPGGVGVTLPLINPNLTSSTTPPGRLGTVGSADTYGSYFVVGTVPFDTHWAVPCPFVGSALNTFANGDMVIDYAVMDQAGSSTNHIAPILVRTRTTEDIQTISRPYPVNWPAGTIISARGKFASAATGTASFIIPGITCIGPSELDLNGLGQNGLGATRRGSMGLP